MIQLDSAARPMNAAWLQAHGGFAWWYLEILDEAGDGLVLIWSFGLPFLPGYIAASRQGQPQQPQARPSLNLAVYEKGEPVFYVLHEFRPEDCTWDGGHRWTFGDTEIEASQGADGERSLEVRLDCPLRGARERVQGRIRASGPLVHLPQADQGLALGDTDHSWAPIAAPAFGTALLSLEGGRRFKVAGRAYHDRNGSSRGLHQLGIDLWFWGHVALPEGERIFYILWPEEQPLEPVCAGFEVSGQGQLRVLDDLAPRLEGRHKTFYGMTTWESVHLERQGQPWVSLTPRHLIDNGPFYLRYLMDVQAHGSQAGPRVGSAEVIDPSRIDLDRHRPLVRMRVATDMQRNSIWLPLFQGSRQGRVARLFQSLTRGRAPVHHQEPT